MLPVPGKPSWAYGPEGLIRKVVVGSGESRRTETQTVIGWCPLVEKYIVRWDSKGKITDARYSVTVDGHTDTIDADELTGAESWKRWPAAVGVHDRTVREVLAIVIQDQARRLAPIAESPYWAGDNLILPGPDLMEQGYGERFHVPEEVQELLAIAGRNPKVALVMGFSYAAPYVEPLDRQGFWVHMGGDSSAGKTSTLFAAGSLHGRPGRKGINRPWNATANGISLFLGNLSVMPAYLDELHMAGFAPAALKRVVHTTVDGADKFVSTRTRKLRTSAAWHGVLFSTGNYSVTGVCPQAEIAVRVVEIPSPLTDSAGTSNRLRKLARENYGWWTPVTLDSMRQAIRVAENRIGIPEDGGAAERVVENLALGVAGAYFLGGAGLAEVALVAARDLLKVQVSELREEGVKPSEKLLEAVRQALYARPFSFPSRTEYESWLTADKPQRFEIEGFREGDLAQILTTKMDRIGKDAGLDNVRIALREMRSCCPEGALKVGSEAERLRKKLPRLDGKSPSVYEIDLSHECAAVAPVVDAPAPAIDPWVTPADDAPELAPAPVVDAPELAPAVPAARAPSTPRDHARVQQRADLGEQLADFTKTIERSGRFPEVSERDLLAGLKTFSAALDGLSFAGAPSRVGYNLFQKLGAQYASVPTLGAPPSQPVDGERVQTMFNLLDKSADPGAHRYLVGLDVNAQFLAAAVTVPLGTGEPVAVDGIGDDWRTALKRPGYYVLAEDVTMGPGRILLAGDVIASPTALYLMQRDGRLPVTGGYQWEESRRWLALWSRRVGVARAALLDRGDVPSALALAAVKAMYASFLGGWLASGPTRNNYNQTETLRPDWMHMIHSLARVNMLRSLAKSTVQPFATLADAAYFLTDDVMDPRGLEISTQPGKWKAHRLGLAGELVTITVGNRHKNTTLAEQIERGSLGGVSKVAAALDGQYRKAAV